MAQAVATLDAVPALTAVQVRFRRAPQAPPKTPAGEAALPPLYFHGIVFWDEHHKKVRLERVVEDLDRFIVVLDTIIAAGGCVLTDELLRTRRGRCARTAKGC
jgi:hypothetical protein